MGIVFSACSKIITGFFLPKRFTGKGFAQESNSVQYKKLTLSLKLPNTTTIGRR